MRTATRFIVATLLAGLVCGACSKKVELDLTKIAPFENLYTDDEIAKGFVNLQVAPFGRQDLTFSMLVPKDWRDIQLAIPKEEVAKANEDFIPICRQRAPEGEPGVPMIEVQVLQLELEVGLTDFVLNYLESQNLKPLAHNRGVYNGRQVEDVVIRTIQDKSDFVARMTFSKHGNRMFVVVSSAEASYFMNWAKPYGLAAVSFTPKQSPQPNVVEELATFVNPGPPYLEFRYPASWTRKDPSNLPPGKVGTDIVLQSEGKVLGYIHAKAVLKAPELDPNVAIIKLKRDFENAGVAVGSRLRLSDLDSKQPAPLAKVEVWKAKQGENDAELATLVYENASAYYSLGMLIPTREQNTMAWMTSWKVFEIVSDDIVKSMSRTTEVAP